MNTWDEDRSVFNGHFELDILIDSPVEKVWSQYMDTGSWVTSHDIEFIHGSPGTLGAVKRVAFKRARELGMPPPHYHFCKIIKLVPNQQHALKTYTESAGAYGMRIIAFDDTRFHVIGTTTKVTFNIFMETRSEAAPKDPSAANMEASRAGMLVNLNNLKRIVEGR